ncbi:hypothetical protein ALC152_14340 [Arcobacter sp. 15-2]|uniref:hypothetical protein n=1 Tax=Arcobacter sp. 15-2 TaxID=3374109 RepID=UPI00399CCE37
MKFNNLSHEGKLEIQKLVLQCMNAVGGRNYFLGMIENIKASTQHPLLNKTAKYHFENGTISWKKQIFKEKVIALKNMFIQHNEDNLLLIKNEKLNKEIRNCIKTMGKLEFVIQPKEGNEFLFTPFNTISEDNIESNPIFQIIFFDSINNTKRIIDYK